MGDGLRIFRDSDTEVFDAQYLNVDFSEVESGRTTPGVLALTQTETGATTRLDELRETDALLAYTFRTRLAQDVRADAPALRRGDRGPRVEALQNTLVSLGHLSRAAVRTGPGLFGPQTERAVREFQRANGVDPTGVYDDATRAVVASLNDGVRRGARGPLVSRLQERLVELNYLTPRQVATGPGLFGPQTEAALKQFQAEHGIRQTGALGPTTYRALLRATPRGTGEGGGNLRLSADIRERASYTRQQISSPVLGEFTITASFMDPDGHGYKRGGAYAIYANDPQTIVRIPPSRVNLGIDYVTADGRIRNWFGGTVQRVTYENGYGHRAIIRTDMTYRYQGRDYTVYSHYAHAAGPFSVQAGDTVTPGQDIGRMGNTGVSQGPHVDFRTWIQLEDGRIVDISPNLLVNRRQQATTRPNGALTLGVNERYRDALLLAERRTGIDAAALAGLINAEAARDRQGRWIANSYNPDSGARGLTQFIEGTWIDRATTAGSYLNEVALERGFIRRENNRFVVVDRQALLALRNDPTASIVSAAEYGRDNLASLGRLNLLPADMTDDDRARYMYYAHHEGMAGAVRLLTNSDNATEAEARRALVMGRGTRRAAAMQREHGSYLAAFRVWTEARARYLFPIQVGSGRDGQRIMARYLADHGDYEHAYRAWLEDYTARQVRPDNYRR